MTATAGPSRSGGGRRTGAARPTTAGSRAARPGGAPPRAVSRRKRRDEPATPRPNVTGRLVTLALVVCALAVSLAYPVRSYLDQRAQIADLRAQVTARSAAVAELQQSQQRWEDPAYVRAQARERLHYVLPGETQYVVLEPDSQGGSSGGSVPGSGGGAHEPWFVRLWNSTVAADTQAPPVTRRVP